jgi:hypothetical protein
MPDREDQLHYQTHAMAKTNKYTALNLINLVVNTGVTRGPNLNLNTFILHHSP